MLNKRVHYIMVFMAMVLPTVAMAQLFGEDATSGTDVAVKQFLEPLFGQLVGKGGGDDPLAALFKTFNQAVLFLGGIMMGYTILGGLLATAHDGEMLGKRWSSLWVPIRTVLGAAAILPTIGVGGSYAAIQALVMWFALQGVNMANAMWISYIDTQDPVSSAFYTPPNGSRQIRGVLNDMFMSNVCVEAFKATQSKLGSAAASIGMNPLDVSVGNIPGGYVYGTPIAPTLCGSAYMNPLVTNSSGDAAASNGPASTTALFNSENLSDQLRPVHESHINSAQAKLAVLAKKLVDNQLTNDEFSSEMNQMVMSYADDLKTTAQSVYEGQRAGINEGVKDGMRKDGFALAGMYYMAIIRAQDEITRAITQTPTTSSGSMSGSGSFAVDIVAGGGNIASAAGSALTNMYIDSSSREEYFKRAKEKIRGAQLGESSFFQIAGEEATENSWVMKVVNWFVSDDLTLAGNSNYAAQGQNPIIMAKNLGENMTATAWGGLAIGVIALGLSGAGAGILGDWATVLTPLMFSLFSLLVVPGAVLSTYVPMIPYILWTGVMIGWIILVIEALIGSVIWALSHLAPDGDGVVGRGGQGYMLVLSLVLRPPLMIFGLAASIALMKPMGFFINTTFMTAFGIGVNPGPFGLTQAIAGCIIYTVVMISVIHRVFTLIHVVPDRILRWIGGGGNELGEQANSMESFSAGKVGAGLMATKAAGDLSQSTMQGVRDMSRKKQDRALADASRKEESGARMAQIDANENDNSHRQGLEADGASKFAMANPNDAQARDNAAFQNQEARESRLHAAETGLSHYLQQNSDGKMNLGALNNMSPEERQNFANSKEGAQFKDAIAFNEQLQSARQASAHDPSSKAMENFLSQTAAKVRDNPMSAQPWERSAAKALRFEQNRAKFSGPPNDPPEA